VGGALDDRGGVGLGGREGAGDQIQDGDQIRPLAAPVKVPNGAAGEFEGAGPVVEARGENRGEGRELGAVLPCTTWRCHTFSDAVFPGPAHWAD
jgi:hypothetical protein